MKEVVAVRRLLFFVVLLVSTMLPSWWWPVVAQAFQLPNNNNNHHHLVPSSSLVHPHNQQEQQQQQTPTKAQTQPLLFPLPNKKTRKTPSSSSAYYHYFSSPIETVATQINRTVNRNTKNRQNHSICSLEKPHSTLHEITTTTTPSPPPNSIINISSNNNTTTKKKTKKKESSIQRSLRQLGITIASLFIIVVTTTTTTTTQQQWNVANAATIAAAAAYTPLIVTHHPSTTTTVTPLVSKTLSNSHHHHHHHQGSSSSSIAAPLLLLPSSVMKMIMTGLYHPAIGDIIMSFAYVIIALGVSHMLANVAMGGHVKVMKLMAWRNLFEEDEDADAVDDATTTATATTTAAAAAIKSTSTTTTTMKSRTSSSSSRTNNILAQMTSEIQGLFSRYIYMIRLIFDEIHKASIIGQRYTTATTATSTTTPSNNMLSRYASNLNMSFQDIFKTYPTKKEKEEDDGGVVGMNWEEYSKLLQQKKNKTKKSSGSSSSSSSRKWMKFGSRSGTKGGGGGGGWVYNKFTMLFEPAVVKSDTEEAIKKATDLFKQKQYEQHHHRVHVVVPHTQFEESTRYLDGLTKFASIGEVEQQQHKEQHAVVGTSKGYLDTLSEGEVMRKSTWEVYKGLVEKVVKEVKHQNEIDYLKEELAHIQSLLQDEQSMYQTSNQALNLVVEAQNEELKHARAASTQYSTTVVDELKEFDIKAKEYEEAMKESKKVESGGSTSTSESPHKWIF